MIAQMLAKGNTRRCVCFVPAAHLTPSSAAVPWYAGGVPKSHRFWQVWLESRSRLRERGLLRACSRGLVIRAVPTAVHVTQTNRAKGLDMCLHQAWNAPLPASWTEYMDEPLGRSKSENVCKREGEPAMLLPPRLHSVGARYTA